MQEGVNFEELTSDEQFVRFERMQSYVVSAGKRHQIVHNCGQDDIGIAFSKNGRRDFRQCDKERIYWYTGPYAYVTLAPMESQGIVVDLSRLV